MLVDVSHIVEHGMVTYKGLPAPLVCDFDDKFRHDLAVFGARPFRLSLTFRPMIPG